jgi:hypothetical protein
VPLTIQVGTVVLWLGLFVYGLYTRCQKSLLENSENGLGGTGFQPGPASAEVWGRVGKKCRQSLPGEAFRLVHGGYRPPYPALGMNFSEYDITY